MNQLSQPSMLPPPRRPACAQDWEEQRLRFQQLYSAEDRPLGEVMEVMEKEYGFRATYVYAIHSKYAIAWIRLWHAARERQYKRKISQWNLDKNVKNSEMLFIVHTQKKRKAEGKVTKFRVRGRLVEPEKIARTVKRKNISEDDLLAQSSPVAGECLPASQWIYSH